MKNFVSVKQGRISDMVLKQLKEAILTGRYTVGEKLPAERELIEKFQVSRAVIREAIRALEIAGFINIRQGPLGGAFVNELSFNNLDDAYQDLFLAEKLSLSEFQQVRLFIEPSISRLVAEKMTPELAAKIEETVANESGDGLTNSELLYRRTRLHCLLAEASENRFLAAIINNMVNLTLKVFEKLQPDCNVIHPVGMHDDLIEALISGDADKSEKLMFVHLSELSWNLEEVEREFRSLKG